MNFDSQVCLVTGASRGIGAAIALEFAKNKAGVVIVNYSGSKEKAEAVAVQIEELGSKAVAMQCDISDKQQCEAMIGEIVKQFGRVDVLVNNAGITRDGLILKMSEQDFDSVIATNLKGVFNMTQPLSKIMLKQKYGRIVNLCSVSGIYGNAGQANYSASKAGVAGFTKAVAKELASRNITCNAVAPGFIDTDMTGAMPDAAKEAVLSAVAMKRAGKPEEVAAVVAFLASKEASYITGQIVEVSGGM